MNNEMSEAARLSELSDVSIVNAFEAACTHDDMIDVRDMFGRDIMGRVFDRIGDPDLARVPLLLHGAEVIRHDGQPATLADYLSVSVDRKHGADSMILEFVKVQVPDNPEQDPTYSKYIAGLKAFMDIYLEELSG
ncbi:MAG TPA: hypothetical protein VLG47_01560 [Candidatus Saccharimonadales bacterium]|nr:hypothetical protein [Candidatus Saccharimonadales bacterium]